MLEVLNRFQKISAFAFAVVLSFGIQATMLAGYDNMSQQALQSVQVAQGDNAAVGG